MSKKKLSSEDLVQLDMKQKYELLRKKQEEKKPNSVLEDKKKELEKRLALAKMIKKNQEAQQEAKKTVKKQPQIIRKLHEESLGFTKKTNTETTNNNNNNSKAETTEQQNRSFYNPSDDNKRFSQNNNNSSHQNNYNRENEGFHKKKRGRNSTGDSDIYPNTVFVGDLSETTEQHHLEELFQQYGKLDAVRIIQGKNFGFVKYYRSSDAQKAIEGLNGQILCGATIRVSAAKVPQQEKRWHGPPNQHWDSNFSDNPDFQDHLQRQKFYGHQGDEDDIPRRELIVYDL